MEQLWAPWRMTYVGSDAPPGACVFCSALEGDDESHHIVERADLTFTILNRYPYSSGHVMVVPLRHVADITHLTPEESAALLQAATRVEAALTATMHPGGFNLGINQGPAAGASLDHLHLHVVPRWGGDTNFMPVLGDVKVIPQHLEETAAQLRTALAAQPKG